MSDPYQSLSKLIDFPKVVDFRIIVLADVVNSMGIIKETIESIETDGMQEVKTPGRVSKNGNYVSYIVPIKVSNGDNLKKLYEKIGSLNCVKMIL